MSFSAFGSCLFAGAGAVTIGSMGQGTEFTKCIKTIDLTTKTLDDDITLVDRESGGCCPADSVPGIKAYAKYQGAQIVCGFKADGSIKMSESTSNSVKTCVINKCYVMKQNIPCKDGKKQLLNGCCGPKPQTNFADKCLFYDLKDGTTQYCTTYHKTYKMLNTQAATDDIVDDVLQVDKYYTYTPCEGSSLSAGAATKKKVAATKSGSNSSKVVAATASIATRGTVAAATVGTIIVAVAALM